MRPLALLLSILALAACGDEADDPLIPPAVRPGFEWFLVVEGDTLRGRGDGAVLQVVPVGESQAASFALQGGDGLAMWITAPDGRTQVAKRSYEVGTGDAEAWRGWLDRPAAGSMEHYGRMWGSMVLSRVDGEWVSGDFDLQALRTDAQGIPLSPEVQITLRGLFRARVEGAGS